MTIWSMDSNDVIKMMMERSGATKRELSRAMGRSDNYVATTLMKSKSHSFELVREVADALGYTIEVSGHGSRMAVNGEESDLAGLFADGVNEDDMFS